MVQIPNYIAGANCAGTGYLVQASSGGSSVFFANEDMAADYVSAAEADEIYATSSGDPDCIMRRLVPYELTSLFIKIVPFPLCPPRVPLLTNNNYFSFSLTFYQGGNP